MDRKYRRNGDKQSRQRSERRQAFPPAVPKAHKTAIGRSTSRETPLHVRVRGTELDDATRDYVRARVGFKLGKFALRLVRVTVRFENVAGPKGAPAHVCKVKVVLPNTADIVVATTNSSARAAFDQAADATERSVRRSVGRARTRARAPRNRA